MKCSHCQEEEETTAQLFFQAVVDIERPTTGQKLEPVKWEDASSRSLPETDSSVPRMRFKEEWMGLLRVKYRKRAAEILAIVMKYKTDKMIVEALKQAGIVSKSSYWRDIRFYRLLRDQLLSPPVNSGSD